MLAKSVPSIPPGASYEPKWDGFRSICFRDGDEVELGSRNERPMTRYFPELVAAVTAELPERCVIDGEIVIATDHGLDFEALQQRIHPADSRVRMLAEQTPASFIAFDLLALGDDDYTAAAVQRAPRRARRRVGRRRARRSTSRPRPPTWRPRSAGSTSSRAPASTGSIAKPLTITYQPDKRVMFKIKHERTADCVVAGYRRAQVRCRRDRLAAARALQGRRHTRVGRRHRRLPDGQAAASCSPNCSRSSPTFDDHPWNWAAHMAGERTPRRNEGSRWNAGKDLSFVPLRPERVVEVRYDHMEGERFRHTAQFNRWRPDRDPRSCTYEQLEQPVTFSLGDIVPGLGPGNA